MQMTPDMLIIVFLVLLIFGIWRKKRDDQQQLEEAITQLQSDPAWSRHEKSEKISRVLSENGWEITSQNSEIVQAKKPKQFSWIIFILLTLTMFLPGIIYAIMHIVSKPPLKTVIVE